jgi:hypothetical protein
MKSLNKVEFGDFQTPVPLAREACELLLRLGEEPEVVLEPTVGRGAFLLAAGAAFPGAQLRGFDINPEYVQSAAATLEAAGVAPRATVVCQDFFSCDWEEELARVPGKLLLLGNPPWVTNSGVGAISGSNLPIKENFLGLRGIAARTGKANFDISEWMLIRLLRALHARPASLAMLCKTATARKFLRYAWQNDGRIATASIYRIDAAEHFDASVDACLLYLRTGSDGPHEADVFASLSAVTPTVCIGLSGIDLVADLQSYRALRHHEGSSAFRWRSGIKHDCAAIMELRPTADGGVATTQGLRLDLEPDYLFPFLKCSDLANGRSIPDRLVLVTQRFVGDDTAVIAKRAPRTWTYLQAHRERFLARKSSIYKAQVPFALFGIGEYAFAPWKVAVSGLHRSARFQVIGPIQDRPVFFDDASYYLPFDREEDAQLVAEILNSAICQRFLSSLIFPDAKRPVTVDLLQRLNLSSIAAEAGLGSRWQKLQETACRPGPAAPQMEFVMEDAPARAAGDARNARPGFARK